MFISYGMTSFTDSDAYVTNMLIDPPPPSTFAAPSTVDSAQWATEAANLGCDYAVLTLGHHIGFNVFPYTAPYNGGASELTKDSTRGNLTVPVYTRYDVSMCPSSDQDIIGKFVNQCAIEGIKCGLYYNVGKNINMRRGLDLIDAAYDQTNTYSLTYQNYVDFAIKEIEWICREYSPDYIWLDAPHHAPRYYGNVRTNRRYYQDFYNIVKRTSPNTLVFYNYDAAVIGGQRKLLPNGTDATRPPFTWAGDELMIFPGDVPSFESQRIPTDAGALFPPTNHEAVEYYLPKEIITTILTSGQYFARNDNFNSLESSAALQALYDNAKASNVPFLLNVAVAKNGVIPSNQLTRFGEIVL